MSRAPSIDIRPDHWEIVSAILEKHVPQYEVWAFGSRAKWTAKEFSDLDLAIITDKPLPLEVSAALEEAFSESNLPFKVDVVDWAATGEGFRNVIEKQSVVIQNNWKNVLLREVAELFDGPHATPPKAATGTKLFLGISSLSGGRIDISKSEYISDIDHCKWTKRITPQPGDMVFSYETRLGEAALIPEGLTCCLGRRLGLLRPHPEKIDNRFLLYYYLGPDFQAFLKSRTVPGSTVDRISLLEMPNYPLLLPPLPTQRAIAHILGTLDDKIECNRRMNETLEAMARVIFKDWFVDFSPVCAKMEGRQPEGMSAKLAALFPDRLDDEGKPEGWRAATLEDLVTLNPKESLRKGEKSIYVEMADLPTNLCCIASSRLREFTSGSKFRQGDTLLARITPCLENGKTAFVHFLEDNLLGWGSTEFIVLRAKKDIPQEFCYLLAREEHFREYAIKSMTGSSGRQRVQAESLASYSISDPQPHLWKAFGEIISPWFAAIFFNTAQSQTLTALRDILLPKLISGELRIKDAEKFVEEALDA